MNKRIAILGALVALIFGCGTIDKVKSGDVRGAANSAADDAETAKAGKALLDDFMKIVENPNEEQEYYAGRTIGTRILEKSGYKYLDADAIKAGKLAGLTDYVNSVGQIVAQAAMNRLRVSEDRPAPLKGFHFVIIDSPVANGVSAPSGFVFVTKGAIDMAKAEDELAALLAHEVAHVVRGHSLQTMKQAAKGGLLVKGGVAVAGAATGNQAAANAVQQAEWFGKLTDVVIEVMFVKGYSRDTEYEADDLGTQILKDAGYDPRAMVTLLRKLEKNQDTGDGGFRATHPPAGERASRLESAAGGGKPKIPKIRISRLADAKKAG